MTPDEIQGAVRNLPLTHMSLCLVLGMADSFANSMRVECDVVGIEAVCESTLDAVIAADKVFAVTLDMRSERAVERMLEERHDR